MTLPSLFQNKTTFLTLILASAMAVRSFASPADLTKESGLAPADGGITVLPPASEEHWLWNLPAAHPARSSAASIKWTIHYWDGTEVSGDASVVKPATTSGEVAPAHDAPLSFSFTPKRLGWARLTAHLVDAKGGTLLSAETTLTVGAPDKGVKRAFRYGFCAHSDWLNESEYKLSILTLGASGVDMVRDCPDWNSLEPKDGKWVFDKMDRLVNDAGAVGIEIQPLLAFTAHWASTGNQNTTDWHEWNNKMPKLDPWLDYVKTMVHRYHDRIHYWEVWNEPDHSFWLDTPENYLLLFNKTAEAVKQVDPKAKVMNGGLTFIDTDQDIAVRRNLFTKGDRANWDLFAYHNYMTFEQLLAASKVVDYALKGTGLEGMRRWLNESGAHTLVPDGERTQLLQLVKKISIAPALGIDAFFWYDLHDDGADASTTEHRLGVVDSFYRPRPAYAAYQNLIRELAPRHYFPPAGAVPGSQPGPNADGIWLAGYAGDEGGEHCLVAWRGGKGSSPMTFHWPEGTAIERVDDVMGNPVDFSNVGGYAVVALGEEPVYIRFTGKAVYPTLGSFLRFPPVVAALPGQTSSLVIGIRNPTGDPLQIILKGSLSDGGKDLFRQKLKLQPGEDKQVTTDISWPQEALSPGKIALEVTFPSTEKQFRAAIPYQVAHVIPRGVAPNGKMEQPQFVLNKRENIISLSEGLAQAGRDWKGPEDLSATASFFYDDTALHIAIDVQDDVHFQEGHPLRLWEGDGLQFAIKMNDGDVAYLQAEAALPTGKKDAVTWVDKAAGRIPAGALPVEVTCHITRQENLTSYRIDLPWATLDSNGIPINPFRISFLINDNDGKGRRQWVELSPGIGLQQDPSLFPLFYCK